MEGMTTACASRSVLGSAHGPPCNLTASPAVNHTLQHTLLGPVLLLSWLPPLLPPRPPLSTAAAASSRRCWSLPPCLPPQANSRKPHEPAAIFQSKLTICHVLRGILDALAPQNPWCMSTTCLTL